MDEYTKANQALWNERTPFHAKSDFYDLESFKAGGIRLRDYELAEIGDVAGKELLHLQCHFGIDTLSWARLGARPTGVDYSEPAITLARSLAEELGLDARFVLSPIEDLPEVLDGDFDVVYTSRGVICWLPDLRRWAEVIAHFLRPGGVFYLNEGHPIMWVLDDEDGATTPRLKYPYFASDVPLQFPTKGTYADLTADIKEPYEYGWVHDIGEVVTSLAQAGLRIEFLHEFPFVEWPLPFVERHDDGHYYLPETQEGELPLSFSLKATKD